MATKVKTSITKQQKSQKTLKLILSDEKNPKVSLKLGMRLDEVAVSLADPKLKRAKPIAARLCGGSSTCLALVDI